jgi:hypothetical protein
MEPSQSGGALNFNVDIHVLPVQGASVAVLTHTRHLWDDLLPVTHSHAYYVGWPTRSPRGTRLESARIFSLLLAAMVTVSLVVGGIGIMKVYSEEIHQDELIPMSNIRGFKGLQPFVLLLVFLIFFAGCATDEPTPTSTTIADLPAMDMPSTTPTASFTPQIALPSTIPTHTTMPTETAVPTQTPIPLPLAPMTPFPTVTPDYVEYETKPVFIALIGCCGDGGSETDYVMGRDTPSLIIYGDGQMVIQSGEWGKRTFLETYLSPKEMCQFRQRIADTGFLEPHEVFFTERDNSMGVGSFSMQVEDT